MKQGRDTPRQLLWIVPYTRHHKEALMQGLCVRTSCWTRGGYELSM